MSRKSYCELFEPIDYEDGFTFYTNEYGKLYKNLIEFSIEHWDKLPYDKVKEIFFYKKEDVPNDLNVLVNVENLYLGDLGLEILPDFSKLKKLKYLFCQGNNLIRIPSLSGLTSLKYIGCQYNKITEIGSLDGLVNLTSLECFHNELTSLPCLDTLENLVELNCGDNNISVLPDFSKLQKLQNLVFYGNPLTKLPYSIVMCKSLKTYKPFEMYVPDDTLPDLIHKRIEHYYYKDIMEHYKRYFVY